MSVIESQKAQEGIAEECGERSSKSNSTGGRILNLYNGLVEVQD